MALANSSSASAGPRSVKTFPFDSLTLGFDMRDFLLLQSFPIVLLRRFQASGDEVDVRQRGFDAALGLLLKGVENVDGPGEPHGADVTVGISRAVSDALQNASAMRDIGESKRAEDVQIQDRQQAVIAELDQRTLGGIEISLLMDKTVELIAETLQLEYCMIWELIPDGAALMSRAGVGWKKGLVGRATVGTETNSQAGYTLNSDQPVIVTDLGAETRFSAPPLLTSHKVVSGISVVIEGPDRPYGVIGVHTTKTRAFSWDDIEFLRTAANILAKAIQHKRTKEALRESEEQYKELVERSPDVIWRLNLDGVITYVSPAIKCITGCDADEIVGLPFDEFRTRFMVGVNRDQANEMARRLRGDLGTDGTVYELTFCRSDGTLCFGELRSFPILDRNGGIVEIHGLIREITERKLAEEALATSEASLAEAQKIAHLGTWERNFGDGRVVWSDETFRIFGVEQERFKPQYDRIVSLVHPEDREIVSGIMRPGIEGLATSEATFRIIRPDGLERTVRWQGRVKTGGDGEITGIFGTVHDITDQMALERGILEVSEREQRRIGEDLHDGAGQIIHAARFMCEALERKLGGISSSEASDANRIIRTLEEADDQLHSAIKGLHPMHLESRGLASALRQLALDTERTFSISCRVDYSPSVSIEAPEVANHLYRIAQEAVRNGVKHGQAKNIEIDMKPAEGRAVLTVSDDGGGHFDPSSPHEGLGLRIMRHRSRLIKAALDILTDPAGGTTIVCSVPVRVPAKV